MQTVSLKMKQRFNRSPLYHIPEQILLWLINNNHCHNHFSQISDSIKNVFYKTYNTASKIKVKLFIDFLILRGNRKQI